MAVSKITRGTENQQFSTSEDGIEAVEVYYVFGAGSVFQALNASAGGITIPIVGQAYVDRDLTDPNTPVETIITDLPCTNVECTNIDTEDDLHEITVTYENTVSDTSSGGGNGDVPQPPSPALNDESWNLEPAGSDVIVRIANKQEHVPVSAPDPITNIGNLIGVDDGGVANGVSIPSSEQLFRLSVWKNTADVPAYLDKINGFRNTVNSTTFYGWEPGAVRCEGGVVVSWGSTLTEVQITFVIGTNEKEDEFTGRWQDKDGNPIYVFNRNLITLAGTGDNTGYAKYAWWYIWQRDKQDKEGKTYTEAVWVSEVFKPVDWNHATTGLGLSNDRTKMFDWLVP